MNPPVHGSIDVLRYNKKAIPSGSTTDSACETCAARRASTRLGGDRPLLDLRMPVDNASRNRVKKPEAQAGIDDEEECYYHPSAGIGELQRVGHYDAETALGSK